MIQNGQIEPQVKFILLGVVTRSCTKVLRAVRFVHSKRQYNQKKYRKTTIFFLHINY